MNVVIQGGGNNEINVSNFNCVDFLFQPARWCHKQWRNLTSPLIGSGSKLSELLKRMAIFIPLIFTTGMAYVIGLFGVVASLLTCKRFPITPIIGSGINAERRADLSAYQINSIQMNSSGTLIVKRGEASSLVTTAEDNVVDLFPHHIKNSELVIAPQRNFAIQTHVPVCYHLTLPNNVKDVHLHGTGHIDLDQVDALQFSCKISGTGDVQVKGGATAKQTIVISGMGNYNARHLEAEISNIKISGSGKAVVHATRELSVKISGIGNCEYYGRPLIQQKISGIGRLVNLD